MCSDVCGYDDKANFDNWWKKKRTEMGYPELNIHRLRHTQATLLQASGVDTKTTQTRLGHSSSQITVDWYTDAVQANDDRAADLMGELMNGKRKQRARIIEMKSVKTA